MKKLFFFFHILLYTLIYSFLTAQAPGGVQGAKFWFDTEQHTDEGFHWKNMLSEEVEYFSGDNESLPNKAELLNFNHALQFKGTESGLILPLGTLDWSKATFFTVYQAVDSMIERNTWTFEKNSRDYLILTSHRLADMEAVKYMNFVASNKELPSINTYIQYKEKDTIPAVRQDLYVGCTPVGQQLPIAFFEGIIPEIIIYDRVLSPVEKLKVESYLALKYGLTVNGSKEGIYLNAASDTIWNGLENSPFNSFVTGIGRDDKSGLYQKQSSSSYEHGLFTIGVEHITRENESNSAFLHDQSFLIWGDDRGSLGLKEKTIGQPRQLYRKWLIQASGEIEGRPTILRFESDQFDTKASRGYIYWLMVDKSGTGKFPLGKVDYYQPNNSEADSIYYKDVFWDTDKSGTDVFTLALGPEMMPIFWLDAPTCIPETNGALHVGAVGGKAPYQFKLQKEGIDFLETWQSNHGSTTTIENIESGDYTLTVEDSDGHSYVESFFVQSSDAPVSSLASNYTLMPNQSIELDAANTTETGIDYQWLDPSGKRLYSSSILITEPGDYQLILNKNGCESRQKITVSRFKEDIFKSTSLFPNPVGKQDYSIVEIELHRVSDVNISIRDISGKLVSSKELNGSDQYRSRVSIDKVGIYTISIFAEQVSKTYKLVVN